jgi:hypothetical protein
MRPIYAALICALAVVAARPAQSRGDELDDLLSSPPIASSHEPAASSNESGSDVTADAADHFDLSDSDAASYADQSRWHPVVGLSTHAATKGKSTSDGSAQKSPAPSNLSLVPEPSAVVLAGLALIYFLVFGRRRVFS